MEIVVAVFVVTMVVPVIVAVIVVVVLVAVVVVVIVVAVVKESFLLSNHGWCILKLGALPGPWESENTPEDLHHSLECALLQFNPADCYRYLS